MVIALWCPLGHGSIFAYPCHDCFLALPSGCCVFRATIDYELLVMSFVACVLKSRDGDRSIPGSGDALYSRSAFRSTLFFLHRDVTVLTAASASPFALECFGLTRTCSKL